MEKTRKTKVIALLALVVAVVGMSLGFAAFSNILTISSSATVTPNEGDFKMKIYGVVDETGIYEDVPNIMSYVSEVTAIPIKGNHKAEATDAVIDNSNLTISNLSVNFKTRSEEAVYFFVVENAGKYDSYIKLYDYVDIFIGTVSKRCEPTGDATVELVNEACNSIILAMVPFKLRSGATEIEDFEEMYFIDTPLKLEPGDRFVLGLNILYSEGTLSDGEFTVVFDDIKLEFNTSP